MAVTSDPLVLSSTKHHGLVPSDEFFSRQVYSDDISNYKTVYRNWFAYATNHLEEGSVGLQSHYDIAAVSPMYTVFDTTEDVIPEYLFRVLKTPELLSQYKRWTRGTVNRRGAIRYQTFAQIEVTLPPLPEQRRIAEILDIVDEAIAGTEQVIAKLRQVKAGLLYDLLTCGLDEQGQLRDPVAHPGQFRDSPLGRIPREWEIVHCESVCQEIVVGIVIRPTQYYATEGVPALRSKNVHEDGVIPDDLVYISEESNRLLAKSRLWQGDVITVRTGYPGTSCVVPPEFDGANCIDLIISRPGPSVISDYLATWINSDFGKGQVLRSQGGLAQQHFNVGELKRLTIALPSPFEQQMISAILATHDARIRAEEAYRDKQRLLKAGLMDDLLSGRVRVSTL